MQETIGSRFRGALMPNLVTVRGGLRPHVAVRLNEIRVFPGIKSAIPKSGLGIKDLHVKNVRHVLAVVTVVRRLVLGIYMCGNGIHLGNRATAQDAEDVGRPTR